MNTKRAPESAADRLGSAEASAPRARIRGSVTLLYGFGLSAEGVKNNAFNMFLLFYYQQVAELDAVLVGVALFIALCVDAVIDPAVGLWSDGLRSKLGRRHPFMYAATVPLALCFLAVFHPPKAASQGALFAWLTTFALGTRVAMTLFAIPHQSLVAELTDNYDERTRLQSGRVVFAWLFGLVNVLVAWTVFLRPTPGAQYDPKGFGPLSIFGAAAMFATTLVSSIGTQRAALAARVKEGVKYAPVGDLWKEIRRALGSANYRMIVAGGLFGAVAYGLSESTQYYMNLFFWEFDTAQLSIFILIIAVASLIVMAAAPRFAGRFGKGRVAVVTSIITACVTPAMVALKLSGVLPSSGGKALFRVLCAAVFVGYSALITTTVMIGAMIADVTDEHELRVGTRQEGLLFSANMLIAKSASGLGPLVAGLVIKLAGFPANAHQDTVDPIAVRNLGVLVASFTLTFSALAAWAYSRYRLTRARHAEILAALERNRRSEAA